MLGRTPFRRALSAITAFSLAGLGALVMTTTLVTPAAADTAPVPPVIDRTAQTVTAASLPTVQIDSGVVWDQEVIGNTVYAVGSFTNSRPYGAAAGTNLTARNNILAYDITTGNLITSFDPNVDGEIKTITASPNKQTLYIGGIFTKVGGQTQQKIAAIDLTGKLLTSFKAQLNGTVFGLAATDTTVYADGSFNASGTQTRTRLAAFDATTGALKPDWQPAADADLTAMTLTPDKSKVVIGGKFQNMSYVTGGQTTNVKVQGITALDPTTGAVLPWDINTIFKNGNDQSGIFSLTADNDTVYGTVFNYGTGNYEGPFATDQNGAVHWLADCHGDTYSSYSMNDVVYGAGHTHNCANIQSFPEQNPRREYRTLAFTKAATNVVQPNTQYGSGYGDFRGQPAPSNIYWFPEFGAGTATGLNQAVWSLAGNGTYLAAGGEFPQLNSKPQFGLARFGVPTVAGANTSGPTVLGGAGNPTVRALANNAVRVTWTANWDRDDRNLTYQLVRADKASTPIDTRTVQSTWWQRPVQGFTDDTVQPGQTYRYRVIVKDPNGNSTQSDYVSVTVPTDGSLSPYAKAVVNDNAANYYRLDDTGNTKLADTLGGNDLTKGSGVSGTNGAITGDPSGAATFTNSSGTGQTVQQNGPNTFSVETWIRTTSTSGGKIIGFGDSATGTSSSYDRHVYLDNAGHVIFGVYPNTVRALVSGDTYNDGQWHQIVASLSPAGQSLYIDGLQVGFDPNTTSGQAYYGYWRLGYDNLGGWPNQPSSSSFNGDIDETSIYSTPLTVTQIRDHYVKSGRSLDLPGQPSDKYGSVVYNDNPRLYWRLNDTAGPTIADSGTNRQPGVAAGGVSYGVTSPVSGTTGTAVGFNGSDGTIAAAKSSTGVSTYSEEVWFNTTTNRGGKLIGFGDKQSGYSNNYDRHVYMEDSGQLTFGVWTGTANTITTPTSYNDGKWHHMVATQGSDGMKLYLDGVLTGTNPQTAAQSYNGYWRVGGDSDWGGSSAFFNGSIDEAAVYPVALTALQVQTHYKASPAAANAAPTAAFTVGGCPNGVCSFDASSSSDPDGQLVDYSWDFGDGTTTGSGAAISHTYARTGSYTVKLTVTDDGGKTSTTSRQVDVRVNQAPTAAFSYNCTELACTFDGSSSTDPDGTVAGYSWTFGDNTSGTGATPSHTFTANGTYSVVLTVTDNDGGTNSVTRSVTVQRANGTPKAAFTTDTAGLKVSVDASGSTDPDGSIASYAWDFGDNTATGSGKTTSHTYAQAGTYTVKLTVTDNQGATDSVSTSVVVTRTNASPTAAFTTTVDGLKVSADASGSSDPDGTISNYAWTFGDGSSESIKAPSHTYSQAGTYAIKLTVTDNDGAIDSITKSVTVAAPSATVANDTFGRTTSSGWGSAQTGGAWTTTSKPTGIFSTDGSVGLMKIPDLSTVPVATLDSVSASDVVITTDITLDKLPQGTKPEATTMVMGRRTNSSNYYYLKVRELSPSGTGTVNLALGKVVAGKDTGFKEVTVSGLTYSAGTKLRVKLSVSGSSTASLTGKAWLASGTEPTANAISFNDTSPLTGPGAVGLRSYLGSGTTNAPVIVSYDNFTAVKQ